jgi:hypothetical protein
MFHPGQFIRTSAGHASLLLRPIRLPRDVGRLRVLLQSEAYGALLRAEAASEEARDAPWPNGNDAAAATGRTAITSKHALASEGLSQKAAPPVAKLSRNAAVACRARLSTSLNSTPRPSNRRHR